MNFLYGLQYNLKGVMLALRTPKLLILGLLRFGITLSITLLISGLILYWHTEILNMIWTMPESGWLVYVWKALSWFLSLILAVISMVIAYLIAQLFFCVFIMDYMSRITETIVKGRQADFAPESWVHFFLHLIKQELPRAIIPVLISLFIMIVGLFTPLGPVIIIISSITAVVFLAWDNTDLIAARRLSPYRVRIDFLKHNIFFHIGFGLLFLIPWLNIIFLSFAPVGATLFLIEKKGY